MKNRIKIFLICFSGLTAAAGCSFSGNNDAKRQDKQDNVATDSVSASPADSLAQVENSQLDSMLRVAATARRDTDLAKLYYDIGDIYFNYDYEKAKEYYFESEDLSKKLNWNKGHYKFATSHYLDIINREGYTDSAIVIQKEALELAKKEENESWIAAISSSIGLSYTYKGWYETALNYYNEALPLIEKQGDKFKLAHLHYLIGTVYGSMDMYDEQVTYSEKALNIFDEKPDTIIRAYVLTSYANAVMNSQIRRLEKAENCLLEAQRISMLYNNKYMLLSIYNNLCGIAQAKYDLDKMEMYARKSLEIALTLNDVESYCISNRALGYVEEYKGNFNQSEKYTRKALEAAVKNDLPNEKVECYKLLSELSIARHDFWNYRFYITKADSIQDALISGHTMIYAKEMEAKYESEKKELQITALQKEKRLMTGLGISGSAVLLLALAAFFFLWRYTIQKRKLAETRIKQLEQEKQLIAAQSLLDGENRERSRLSRDLHDGLGSILAGAKINLLEMKKAATLDTGSLERYDLALSLLDKSMSEMRRIAHHLMPDTLAAVGLKQSIADFVASIPNATFSYYGDESRFDSKLEETVYRITHELVTNALKHSGASQILVDIVRYDNHVTLAVQDDGCGFDPDAASSNGMGMNNIRTRIDAFNGNLTIVSKPGVGTEVNVEFVIRV